MALVRSPNFDLSKSAFWPITCCKSNTGTWDVGTLGDSYYFSFASDENHTAGNNETVTSIHMEKDGVIFANGLYAGQSGFFLQDEYIYNSCGTSEPSGWWSGKIYFQYS